MIWKSNVIHTHTHTHTHTHIYSRKVKVAFALLYLVFSLFLNDKIFQIFFQHSLLSLINVSRCRIWAQYRMFVFSYCSLRWRLCCSCSAVSLLRAALCLFRHIRLLLGFTHVKRVDICTGFGNTAWCNEDICDCCPVALTTRNFRQFSENLVANLAPVNKIAEQISIDTTGDVER